MTLIYIYIYMCVCVCVCVCKMNRSVIVIELVLYKNIYGQLTPIGQLQTQICNEKKKN